MSVSCFVEDVWVLPRHIGNDYVRLRDLAVYALQNTVLVNLFIHWLTVRPGISACQFYSELVDVSEVSVEGHEHEDKGLWVRVLHLVTPMAVAITPEHVLAMPLYSSRPPAGTLLNGDNALRQQRVELVIQSEFAEDGGGVGTGGGGGAAGGGGRAGEAGGGADCRDLLPGVVRARHAQPVRHSPWV